MTTEMTTGRAMTRRRFCRGLDLYGGDLDRWPQEDRPAVAALLARSAAARADLARVQRLDAGLRQATGRLRATVTGADVARLRDAVLANLPEGPQDRVAPGAAARPGGGPGGSQGGAPGWGWGARGRETRGAAWGGRMGAALGQGMAAFLAPSFMVGGHAGGPALWAMAAIVSVMGGIGFALGPPPDGVVNTAGGSLVGWGLMSSSSLTVFWMP